ncbi:MAG: cytochrome bc complex cytochrome b subunit [Halobacteria archaeon]
MSSEKDNNTKLETDGGESYERSRIYRWFDDRLGLQDSFLGKAFPEDKYSSFLLGEISLFSFVILVLSGTFLGIFYTPGKGTVEYKGSAAKFAGKDVHMAFESVLRITYDIPMGMFVRMVHHWASYLFIAAMGLHIIRVFFSGSYRNPRELNWMVGAGIFLITLVEGFLGYALPFDNFSAAATRIGFEIAGSIPFIGNPLKLLVFGGEWPGNANVILPRMFFYHVFLVPLIIGGLIGLHMFLLIRQKHTEQKGNRDEGMDVDKDDEDTVTGIPMFPNQVNVMLAVFMTVLGVLSLLAALFPVQRIILAGPSDPSKGINNPAPDWYLNWVFGSLKMGQTVFGLPEWIAAVLVPSIIVAVFVFWPFIDYSKKPVHFTADPIKRPKVTAFGVGALTLILTLNWAGMNTHFSWWLLGPKTADVMPIITPFILILPPLWTAITYYVLKKGQERREKESSVETGGEPSD